LQIVVVFEQLLLGVLGGCGGGGESGGVGGLVVVDGDAVDVVHGADEVVDEEGGVEERVDVGCVGGADEFCFEGDEDVDLGGVFVL
jgi:hypothetical protein